MTTVRRWLYAVLRRAASLGWRRTTQIRMKKMKGWNYQSWSSSRCAPHFKQSVIDVVDFKSHGTISMCQNGLLFVGIEMGSHLVWRRTHFRNLRSCSLKIKNKNLTTLIHSTMCLVFWFCNFQNVTLSQTGTLRRSIDEGSSLCSVLGSSAFSLE